MSAMLLSIDPGAVSGAYAVFYDDHAPFVDDLPVVDGQVNAVELGRIVYRIAPEKAVVERVASMPKQGVASTFKFGMAAGIVHGVLGGARVPMRLITPSEWKKAMRLLGTDKDAARALAIQLYPKVEGLHLKKHQGRADALLLGQYALLGGLK